MTGGGRATSTQNTSRERHAAELLVPRGWTKAVGPCWERFEPERLTQFPGHAPKLTAPRDKQTFGHELKVSPPGGWFRVAHRRPIESAARGRVHMYKIEILEAVSLGADCCSPGLQRGKATNKQQGHGLPASIRSNRPSCSPVVLFHTPSFLTRRGLHMSTIITASAASRWSQRLLCAIPQDHTSRFGFEISGTTPTRNTWSQAGGTMRLGLEDG